jgi:hypothetical protein
MADKDTRAIIGLKAEIKSVRQRARDLKLETERWRSVAGTLRKLAGLADEQFKRLLTAESLPCD